MAEAAGGGEDTVSWYQLSAEEDASIFMPLPSEATRQAEQTDFPSMEEGTIQSEGDFRKRIPGGLMQHTQLDFQDSRLSPCLPLLTSASLPGHKFFDDTEFQQTDTEFAPLRASLDMSELPGSKSLQINDAVKLANKEVNDGGSTELLVDRKKGSDLSSLQQHKGKSPDGGGDISSFHDLSQHPLSSTRVAGVGDSGLEALKLNLQPSIEDLMTEDGAFLGSSVPAPVLLKLLEKEVGMSAGSRTSSEPSSQTISPRDSESLQIQTQAPDQTKVDVSGPQSQQEPSLLEEETFRDSSEIHFEDPEGYEAKPDVSNQSGITVRQSSLAFKEELQKQMCAEIRQRVRKSEAEGSGPSQQAPLSFGKVADSPEMRDDTPVPHSKDDLSISSHHSIERGHKETEMSQAGNTPIDEASFIGRLPHPISQSTPGTFSMNRKQLAGRIQLIKAKLNGSDMSLNEELSNPSTNPNAAATGVPQSLPSSQGYPESSDSQRSPSPQRGRIQSLPSSNYIEKVGSWNTNQSFDALVLRGLTGVSPKKLAYNAVADSLNRMLSMQAGGSTSKKGPTAFKGASSMTNLNVVDKESSGAHQLTRSQSYNSIVSVCDDETEKRSQSAVYPVAEDDEMATALWTKDSAGVGDMSTTLQTSGNDLEMSKSIILQTLEKSTTLQTSKNAGADNKITESTTLHTSGNDGVDNKITKSTTLQTSGNGGADLEMSKSIILQTLEKSTTLQISKNPGAENKMTKSTTLKTSVNDGADNKIKSTTFQILENSGTDNEMAKSTTPQTMGNGGEDLEMSKSIILQTLEKSTTLHTSKNAGADNKFTNLQILGNSGTDNEMAKSTTPQTEKSTTLQTSGNAGADNEMTKSISMQTSAKSSVLQTSENVEHDEMTKSITSQTSENSDDGVGKPTTVQNSEKLSSIPMQDSDEFQSLVSTVAKTDETLVVPDVEGADISSFQQAKAHGLGIAMEQFSDVSLDQEFSGSSHTSDCTREGVHESVTASMKELSHQEEEDFIQAWLRGEEPSDVDELNIEERIPTYLRNLGINQSPTTILTPFTNKGPIREPEFSPTELRTIKSSNATPNRSMRLSEGDSLNGANISQSSFFSSTSTTSVSIPMGSEAGPESPLPTEPSPSLSSKSAAERPISQDDGTTRDPGGGHSQLLEDDERKMTSDDLHSLSDGPLLPEDNSHVTSALQASDGLQHTSDEPQPLPDDNVAEEWTRVKHLIEQFESGATSLHQDNPELRDTSWRQPQHMDSTTNDSFVGSKTLKEIRKLLAEADDVAHDPTSPFSVDQYGASPLLLQNLPESLAFEISHSRSSSPLVHQNLQDFGFSHHMRSISPHLNQNSQDTLRPLVSQTRTTSLLIPQNFQDSLMPEVSQSRSTSTFVHQNLQDSLRYGVSHSRSSSPLVHQNLQDPSRFGVPHTMSTAPPFHHNLQDSLRSTSPLDIQLDNLSWDTSFNSSIRSNNIQNTDSMIDDDFHLKDHTSSSNLKDLPEARFHPTAVAKAHKDGRSEPEGSSEAAPTKQLPPGIRTQTPRSDLGLSGSVERSQQLLSGVSRAVGGLKQALEATGATYPRSAGEESDASRAVGGLKQALEATGATYLRSTGEESDASSGDSLAARVSGLLKRNAVSSWDGQRAVEEDRGGRGSVKLRSARQPLPADVELSEEDRRRIEEIKHQLLEGGATDKTLYRSGVHGAEHGGSRDLEHFRLQMTPSPLGDQKHFNVSQDSLERSDASLAASTIDGTYHDQLSSMTVGNIKVVANVASTCKQLSVISAHQQLGTMTDISAPASERSVHSEEGNPPITSKFVTEAPKPIASITFASRKRSSPLLTTSDPDISDQEKTTTDPLYKNKHIIGSYNQDKTIIDPNNKYKPTTDLNCKDTLTIDPYYEDKPTIGSYYHSNEITDSNNPDKPTMDPYCHGKPMTDSYYIDKPTTDPYYIDKPTTDPYYIDKPTTDPYYIDKPTTDPYYEDKPTTDIFYEDKPTTDPFYKNKLNKDRYYEDKPTTDSYNENKPTTDPLYEDNTATDPFYEDRPITYPYYEDKLSTDPNYQFKPTIDSFHKDKSSTGLYYREIPPPDINYRGKPTMDPYYEDPYAKENQTTDSYYKNKPTTDLFNKHKPTTDQHYEDTPSIDPNYNGKPTSDLLYKDKSSTDTHYNITLSTDTLYKDKSLTDDRSVKDQLPFDKSYKERRPLSISREDIVHQTHCETSTSYSYKDEVSQIKMVVSVDQSHSNIDRSHQLPNRSSVEKNGYPVQKDFVPAVERSSQSTIDHLQTKGSDHKAGQLRYYPKEFDSVNPPRYGAYGSSSPEPQTQPDSVTSPTRKALSCIRVTISPKEDMKVLSVSPALVATDPSKDTISLESVAELPPSSSYFLHSPPTTSRVDGKTSSEEDIQFENKENIPDRGTTRERRRLPLSDATTQITTESPERTTFSSEIFIDGSFKEASNSTMVQAHKTPERLALSHIPLSSFSRATDQPLLLPYRPPGSPELFYVPFIESGSRFSPVSTVESSHPGSNDAISPKFPVEVLGSATEKLSDASIPRHKEGIYSKDYRPKTAWETSEPKLKEPQAKGSSHDVSRTSYCSLQSSVSHHERTSVDNQRDQKGLEDEEFFQLQAEVDFSQEQQSDTELPSRYKSQTVKSDPTQRRKPNYDPVIRFPEDPRRKAKPESDPRARFPGDPRSRERQQIDPVVRFTDDPKRREKQKSDPGVTFLDAPRRREKQDQDQKWESNLRVSEKHVRNEDRSFLGDRSIDLKKSSQRTESGLSHISISNQSLDDLWARYTERRKSQAHTASSKLEISLVERLDRLARLLQNPTPNLLNTEDHIDDAVKTSKRDREQKRETKKAEREKWYQRKFGVDHPSLPDATDSRNVLVSRLSGSESSEIAPNGWSLCSDFSSDVKSTATDETVTRSESAMQTDSGSTVGTGSSISTIDTIRLINAFGPERVRPSSKLSHLYNTIDLQKKRSETSKKGNQGSVGRGLSPAREEEFLNPRTINKMADTDSLSSSSGSWEPSPTLQSKKTSTMRSRGIQAGDLEIVRSATKSRTRDVGTTFPSPRGEALRIPAEGEKPPPKSSAGHPKPYLPPGLSWFVSAENLKCDSRKENKPEGPGPAWYEPVTNTKPWREPLREKNQQEPAARRAELPRNGFHLDVGLENRPVSKLVRTTLQESLKAHRPDFIFRSGERVKRLQLLAEERKLQSVFQSERDELFNQPPRRGTTSHRSASTDKMSQKTKAIPRREMVQRSKRMYEQLPEVRRRKEEEKRRSEYEAYRLKAQLFRKKVTNQILGRKTPWN